MLFFYIIPFLLGALVLVIRYSLWRENYCQNLPGVKPGFFNIPGDLTEAFLCIVSKNGPPVLQYFWLALKERTEKFQPQQLFYIWGFYKPHICIVKAEAVKQLLSKGKAENEKSWHYDSLRPIMGSGLITSTMEKWKPRRKLLSPCFHADILRGFMTVFNERSRKLVKHLGEETKKEFTQIDPIMTNTALDIIFETIFDAPVGAMENNNMSQYLFSVKSVFDINMTRFVRVWEWSDVIFDLTSGRKVKQHQNVMHDIMKSLLQQKKKQYRSEIRDIGNTKRKAFIDLLLELHLEQSDHQLSEEDFFDEVNTFIVAGHETVAHALSWALFLIGLHPEVQEKIHEELDRVFGSDMERDVSENDFYDLKYLDCVLKETQRLYPSAPIIGRNLKEDSNINGYTIPKDSTCLVLIYFLHRDKDVFPDPEKFDPDRFLPENSLKIPDYGYIPFSGGPRNCIGQKFAVMEMKTVIASILRNFTIKSLDSRDEVFPLMYITLHPSIPIRMRFRHRKIVNCGQTLFLR